MTKVPTQALHTLDMLKKLEMQENRIASIQEGDFEGTSTFISAQFSSEISSRPIITARNILATLAACSALRYNDSR